MDKENLLNAIDALVTERYAVSESDRLLALVPDEKEMLLRRYRANHTRVRLSHETLDGWDVINRNVSLCEASGKTCLSLNGLLLGENANEGTLKEFKRQMAIIINQAILDNQR